MVETTDLPNEPRTQMVTRLVQHGLILALLAVTLTVYVGIGFAGFRWRLQPFLGAFVELTQVFNGVGPSSAPEWQTVNQVGRGQLVALDGVPVPTDAALARELNARRAGDAVQLTVVDADGRQAIVAVTLQTFPRRDFIAYFVVPYIIGLLYLFLGVWVFSLRRGEAAGRAFAAVCCLAAGAIGGQFEWYTSHVFAWAWTLAVPALGGALIVLSQVFPQETNLYNRRPLIVLSVSYLPALALAAWAFYSYTSPDPRYYFEPWKYSDLYLGVGILAFLGTVAFRWLNSPSPIVREQSRIIMLGLGASVILILLYIGQLFLSPTDQAPVFNPAIAFPPTLLFPAALAYAILRYRLLDTDTLVAQALVYTVLGALTVAAYALVLTGMGLVIGQTIAADNPVALGLTIFLLVMVFNPLRERLQGAVDATFFRGARANSKRLEEFGRALTRAVALGDIAQALGEQIEAVLRPAHSHLFLRTSIGNEFAAFTPAGQRARTDIRFAVDGALAARLASERAALYLTPDEPLPANLTRDRARLAVLGSAIYVPLPGQTRLAGWLAIGPKLSGEPYRRDEVRFVEALADQSALAVERATVISDLEQRVRELNVLSQMSQAVNFTISHDDLLELIYAQASKIMDTRNFYILLHDPRRGIINTELFVENNERIPAQEKKPWSTQQGLAIEVIRTGQPIRTDDYLAECRRRNVAPRAQNFRAWTGVPLNSGVETIGAMSVASFDPGVTFTEEQLKVFWAIADQAASAIVKSRLYQQTEQRARQLSTLNEVSTNMASTLELDPLLQSIMQSAVDILACEAGSLFLTDEETGESVFRVATGPVGQNLIGLRIAPGRGFVGESIESGAPLIVNDVQNDPRWFKGSDQSTGFVTKALMVVPLRRGGRNVGALEVINKRDGTAFGEDDQTLLTAFAGQAAVAIENARLYTQTDQALAARVEELSVMQRIDRELNEGLDVKRVMASTLTWAMKTSGASAGWVGMVSETSLDIIATQGRPGDGEQAPDRALSLENNVLARVVRTGELTLVRDVPASPEAQAVALPGTHTQLLIPIKREQEVVGLVDLESPNADAFNEEQVAFVIRLVDHASVAITNAKLYAEVNAANIAKSEFVSFVAHELKTPMTSIRGYADLLLGGAVGSVNDMQKQFVQTIRGNVERMATLVSDLADVARIESGRLRLEPKAFAITAVVDDVVRTTQALIDAKQQTLVQEIEANLPNVLADHTRAAQVLTNLMSNAYKYTPNNGQITLRVTRADNKWDPDGAPQVIHVAVQDNGIGIAPEDQKKLFQKFFRAEDRVAREMAPGTGLGLNIVKNLVELQGGRIWFDSEFRKGSTFHFTLPAAPADEKEEVRA